MLEWIVDFDVWLFRLINEALALQLNGGLDLVMGEITILGSLILWVVVTALLWLLGRRREAYLLIVGIIITSLVIGLFKILLPRPRPDILVGARILALEMDSSFPSGHAARSFAAAVILGSKTRRGKIVLYVLAGVVAFSRIYIGVHWPTDVIVGSLLGVGIGLLALRLEEGVNRILSKIKIQFLSES